MKRRHILWLGAALPCLGIAGCILREKWPASPITRVFSPTGIKTVILRAAQARTAKVLTTQTHQIRISGLPTGGAQGYHSPDPFWRETPAKDWGLDFVAKQYGGTLIISTSNEILYIHHHYELINLSIEVPVGTKVIKEERELDGDGIPNLALP